MSEAGRARWWATAAVGALASLLGCKKPFDALGALDEQESAALDRLLAEAGVDRSAMEGERPTVTVSVAKGHVNRLVLDKPPTAPSLGLLERFAELEVLYLVEAVSTLDGLPEGCGLVELRLSGNGLGDLSPLSRCGDLQRLWIVSESLDSLQSLPPLPSLEELYVDEMVLTSLSGVGSRPRLHTLLVQRAGLESLEGLEALPKLRTLDLAHNRLSDASALDGFPALQDVDVTHNRLADFPAVVLRAKVPKILGQPGRERGHAGRLRGEARRGQGT